MIVPKVNNILPEPKLEKIKEKRKTIKCNTCLKELVEVVELLEIKKEDKIKAVCGCGGSSFIHKTVGKWMVRPVNCAIDNVEHPFDSDITRIVCK